MKLPAFIKLCLIFLFLLPASAAIAQLPAINFGYSGDASGCAPHTVVFNISNFSGNSSNTTYTLNFGDGSPLVNFTQSTIPTTVSHSYTEISCGQVFNSFKNAFGATMTAKNAAGETIGTVTPIRISKKPNASFIISTAAICSGDNITFTNNSDPGVTYTGDQCNKNPLFYWQLSGPSAGNVVSGVLGSNGGLPTNPLVWTSGTSPLVMQLNTPGNYQMKLSIGNTCGVDDTTLSFCVVAKPVPQFSITPSSGCAPPSLNVTTSNTTTVTPNACFPTTYQYNWAVSPGAGWNFSGSNTAGGVNTGFAFNAAGNYTITLTASVNNLAGCSAPATQTVNVTAAPVVSAGTDQAICAGAPSIQLNGTPAGGTWSGTGVSPGGLYTPPASVASASNVTLTYTLPAGSTCPALSDQVVVTVNPKPVVSVSPASPAICAGASVSITAGSTIANTTFSWSPPAGLSSAAGATVSANPAATANYTVTGTAPSTGCSATGTVTVTVHPNPSAAVNVPTPAVCAGQCAPLNVTGSGGQGPYTFAWAPTTGLSAASGTSVSACPATTTNYTATVTDARGCTGQKTVAVNVTALPVVDAGPDVGVCNTPTPFTLTGFSPSGGTWSGTGVSPNGVFIPTGPGNVTLTYSVTQSNCTATDQVVLNVTNPTPAGAGADQSICLNASAINLSGTPAGGTWSGTGVTSVGLFTPSASGNVTLTYNFGTGNCAVSDQKVITVMPLPAVSVNDVTICAGEQATLTASGSGATTPYTYSWSPANGLSSSSGASVTAKPTATSTYTVTITAANTCTATDQVTVTVTPLPVVNAGADVGVCNTPTSFTLTGFSPPGGTWSGTGVTSAGVFTPTGTGNVTLTYSVTQSNCTATDQVVLNVTNPTPANAGADQSICNNAPAISLTGTPAGGKWSGSGVTEAGVFTPSAEGPATLTYSFGTGNCAVSDQKVITVLPLPAVIVNDATICAGQQATLTATGSGATTPYSYSWSPAAGLSAVTGPDVTANPTSTTTYTVTITSANTCTATDQATVTVTPLPMVDAGADVGVCNTPTAYFLTGFSPPGGTWSGAGVTATGEFTPTGPGNVTLTYSVTQSNCTASDQVVLNVTDPTPANAGSDLSICKNAPAISLTGAPAGGTWLGSGVSATGEFTPAASGSFTLTYNFGTGNCQVSDKVDITVLELPFADVPDANVCAGQSTQLTATATGGSQPYTYTWAPATGLSAGTGSVVTAQPAATTTYTLSIKDNKGCEATDAIVVNVKPLPVIGNNPDTLGVCNTPTAYTISPFTPQGGIWRGNGVDANGVYQPGGPGYFTVRYIVTLDGCADSVSLVLNVTDPIPANAGNDLKICHKAPAITLSATPSGGKWSGDGITENGLFTPASPGDKMLKYSFGTGNCAVSDEVKVAVLALPSVYLADTAYCTGGSAELTAKAEKGEGPYTFRWEPNAGLSNNTGATVKVDTIASSSYSVIVEDANACRDTHQVKITVHPLPVVDAGNDFTVCFTPIATPLSGATPAGGTWSGNGVTDGKYIPVAAGRETLYYAFTEASTGCKNIDSLSVTANNPDVVNAGNDTSVCISYPTFKFTGQQPSGGVWSGATQVSATGDFTATTTGAVTLYYTTGNGTCAVTDSLIVTVNPLPLIEAGADTAICVNSPPFNFSGQQPVAGGTWFWAGSGITDPQLGTFRADSSGGGRFPVYYNYTENATGCSNRDSLFVKVNALTPVAVSSDTLTVCLTPFNTILTANPAGGIWSGSGINFDDDRSGAQDTAGFIPQTNGWFTAIYRYTDQNSCTNADTAAIEVVSPVNADAGPDVVFCFNAKDTVQLNGMPANGNWSDLRNPPWLLADGRLLLAQADTFMAVFSIGNGSCQTWDTSEVAIFPLPELNAGIDTFRCLDDPCFDLVPVFPFGGEWSGTGITSPQAGTFCSQTALEGLHKAYYTIDTTYYYRAFSLACTNRDSLELLVVPMPAPGLLIDSVICVNAEIKPGNSSSGPADNFEWKVQRTDTRETVFFSREANPVIVIGQPGNYTLNLKAISSYGCSVETSADFMVVTPPVPQFSISADTACAPFQGVITNTSAGFKVQYAWNFGPSFPVLTDTVPQMPVFESPVWGDTLYYVELSLTNLCGTRSVKDSVLVRPQPVAVMGTDYSLACSPAPIKLQNISYGSPDTFFWDFGNGVTSSEKNPPPVTYTVENSARNFLIRLSATNSCGTAVDSTIVTVMPSRFDPGTLLPQTACAPFTFSFNAPAEDQTYYLWNFGDGSGGAGKQIQHTYSAPGTYTLKLIVSNFCFTDSVESTITLNEGPSLAISVQKNLICQNTTFTATNTSASGSQFAWLINGIVENPYTSVYTDTLKQAGTNSIALTGINPANGCRDTAAVSVEVAALPKLQVKATPDTGCYPLQLTFINETTGANAWEWSFDDGTGSTLAEPSLLIERLGAFDVQLIAHNYVSFELDCPDSIRFNVWVNPTPVSKFTLGAAEGCGPPASVSTTNTSTGADANLWRWESNTSTLLQPEITFQDTGNKAVQLKVINSFGCSDSSTQFFRVYGQPVFDLQIEPLSGCPPLPVIFNNATVFADSTHWIFGDGNSAAAYSPVHVYSETGKYSVTVHASTGNGLCTADSVLTNIIEVFPKASASFTATPETINEATPLINLSNESTGYTSLQFFVDSSFIDDQLPSSFILKKPKPGNVRLALVANNSFNCADTAYKNILVKPNPNFYIPTTFSPNGDGLNDTFKIHFEEAPDVFWVQIYNRWGQLIFMSTDPEEGWDGTYMNRGEEKVQDAVYVLRFSAIIEGTILNSRLFYNISVVH